MTKDLINHLELRKLMLENKTFLNALFISDSLIKAKKLLLKSSINEANVLLHVLFSITQGEIPLKKSNFEFIKKKKKLTILNSQFKSDVKFRKILKASLKNKIFILIKFSQIYPFLLYSLFKH